MSIYINHSPSTYLCLVFKDRTCPVCGRNRFYPREFKVTMMEGLDVILASGGTLIEGGTRSELKVRYGRVHQSTYQERGVALDGLL
jgi:hypothetical protein